jgi:aspartokinase-like uncharacterized kinase
MSDLPLKKVFYVNGSIPMLKNDSQSLVDQILALDLDTGKFGETVDTAFPSLLFAFAHLSYLSTKYKQIDASIYLAVGDHFMFSCSIQETQAFT